MAVKRRCRAVSGGSRAGTGRRERGMSSPACVAAGWLLATASRRPVMSGRCARACGLSREPHRSAQRRRAVTSVTMLRQPTAISRGRACFPSRWSDRPSLAAKAAPCATPTRAWRVSHNFERSTSQTKSLELFSLAAPTVCGTSKGHPSRGQNGEDEMGSTARHALLAGAVVFGQFGNASATTYALNTTIIIPGSTLDRSTLAMSIR
jgi:hypothetical protein